MRPGIVLHFRGVTKSPFHSTRQEYANLIKCAPYILGSTIRGALLKRLLERGVCPHVDALNGSYDDAQLAEIHRECALHPFFPTQDELPSAWFSFGQFTDGAGVALSAEQMAGRYLARTRIALQRETRSVAAGAIVTLEMIAPETPFTFDIVLFDAAHQWADALVEAARDTGRGEGWGRFRSIGLGQFEIEKVQRVEFEDWLAETPWALNEEDSSAFTFEFVTPYVLSRGEMVMPSFDARQMAERLNRQVSHVLRAVGETETLVEFSEVALTIRPEFISLYSYERGLRRNSLVTLERSWVQARAHDAAQAARALMIAGRVGIGEWNTRGFGCFRRAEHSHKRYGAYLPRP
jgi:hypothetical protein